MAKALRFEWDPAKARENQRKHGVSFDEARTVFLDEDALLRADDDHSEKEDRFVLLGLSSRLSIVLVCHCYRSDEEVIDYFQSLSRELGVCHRRRRRFAERD